MYLSVIAYLWYTKMILVLRRGAWKMLICDIMQNFGLNFRTVLFMKIQPTGPIVDLETSNLAHFPGRYTGQVFW